VDTLGVPEDIVNNDYWYPSAQNSRATAEGVSQGRDEVAGSLRRPACNDDAVRRPAESRSPFPRMDARLVVGPARFDRATDACAIRDSTRSSSSKSGVGESRRTRSYGPGNLDGYCRSCVQRTDWSALSNTPDGANPPRVFQVTHPFHPLNGREFALVTVRQNWSEDRVYFHNDDGRLISVPTAWTSIGAADPFVVVSAGRSPFRAQDLLELAELIEAMTEGRSQ